MNLVENAAAHTEKPILVFSMEMPAEQLGGEDDVLAGQDRSDAAAHGQVAAG
jgi:hypothetical protein